MLVNELATTNQLTADTINQKTAVDEIFPSDLLWLMCLDSLPSTELPDEDANRTC